MAHRIPSHKLRRNSQMNRGSDVARMNTSSDVDRYVSPVTARMNTGIDVAMNTRNDVAGIKKRTKSKSRKKPKGSSKMKPVNMKKRTKSKSRKKSKGSSKMKPVNMKNLNDNQFYCVVCGRNGSGFVMGKDVHLKTYGKSRRAICGKCVKCNTNVTRFIAKDAK